MDKKLFEGLFSLIEVWLIIFISYSTIAANFTSHHQMKNRFFWMCRGQSPVLIFFFFFFFFLKFHIFSYFLCLLCFIFLSLLLNQLLTALSEQFCLKTSSEGCCILIYFRLNKLLESSLLWLLSLLLIAPLCSNVAKTAICFTDIKSYVSLMKKLKCFSLNDARSGKLCLWHQFLMIMKCVMLKNVFITKQFW